MHQFKRQFIELAKQRDVLRFGEFTLKSGRVSPYFFNVGLFNNGGDLAALGDFYAEAIKQSGVDFDMLFGPAYKGIPLVTTTAVALSRQQRDVPICFNRKEPKKHGEGGRFVGAPLQGKVLIIDDVITAGTAIREAITLIEQAGAEFAGVVVAIDRQERGQGSLSAIDEIKQQYQVPVISVICLQDILDYLQANQAEEALVASIKKYQTEYGV